MAGGLSGGAPEMPLRVPVPSLADSTRIDLIVPVVSGSVVHFPGQNDVDLDVHLLSPKRPKIQTDLSWCVADTACTKIYACPSFEEITVIRQQKPKAPIDDIDLSSIPLPTQPRVTEGRLKKANDVSRHLSLSVSAFQRICCPLCRRSVCT